MGRLCGRCDAPRETDPHIRPSRCSGARVRVRWGARVGGSSEDCCTLSDLRYARCHREHLVFWAPWVPGPIQVVPGTPGFFGLLSSFGPVRPLGRIGPLGPLDLQAPAPEGHWMAWSQTLLVL